MDRGRADLKPPRGPPPWRGVRPPGFHKPHIHSAAFLLPNRKVVVSNCHLCSGQNGDCHLPLPPGSTGGTESWGGGACRAGWVGSTGLWVSAVLGTVEGKCHLELTKGEFAVLLECLKAHLRMGEVDSNVGLLEFLRKRKRKET